MGRHASLDEFVALFGDSPGVLPDGIVVGSERTDWAAVVEALDAAGWHTVWSGGAGEVTWHELNDIERDGGVFAVHPTPGVKVNFFAGPEVLFDFDLREVVTQDALNAIYQVVARLGAACGKPVAISSEGDWHDVVLHYDPHTNAFLLRDSAYK